MDNSGSRGLFFENCETIKARQRNLAQQLTVSEIEALNGTVEMPPSVTSATINRELPPYSVSTDGGKAGWPEFRIYKGGTEGNNISFNDVIEALKMIPQIHATVCKKDEALDAIKALIKEWIEVRLAIRKEWPAAAPTDLIANERRILTAMANWYEDNK